MSYSEREGLGRGVSGKITKLSLAQSTRAGTQVPLLTGTTIS